MLVLVFMINHRWRDIMDHNNSSVFANASISIRKRMDLFKDCVNINTCEKMIVQLMIIDFCKQILPFRLNITRGSTNFMDTCHMIMLFKCS